MIAPHQASSSPPPDPSPGASTAGVPRLAAVDLVVLHGSRRVLDGASLTVHRGEIATLQGASGCGKTTLLRALATLCPLDGGSIVLDGTPALSMPPTRWRTRVAYMPQQPAMLDGTVADNLAAGPRLRGFTLSADRIDALLDLASVPRALAIATAKNLSGGERQRVALARALANEPDVLLLDEPTSALDPEAAARVLDTVRTLAARGLSVVMVTHLADHALALGGTRYECVAGRVGPLAPPATLARGTP